jgi:hypothetical protein
MLKLQHMPPCLAIWKGIKVTHMQEESGESQDVEDYL